MSKNRPHPQRDPVSGEPRPAGRHAVAVRVAVSLWLVWHLAAVFLAPLSVPPSSPLAADLAQRPPVRWYLDLLYLNHGYHFFAPDPSPGHLIRYEVRDDRGGIVTQGEFPNTKDQWPRLRYHRHFMLADQADHPAADPLVREEWQRKYLTAYAHQLLRQHGGETARVERIVHLPLAPWIAEQGGKLNDPATYRSLGEVVERRSALGPDESDQSAVTVDNPWSESRSETANQWQGVRR